MDNEELTEKIASIFEKYSIPMLIISIILTSFLAVILTPLPSFNTELSSFAPETEADEAESRMSNSIGLSSHLIYVNVKPSGLERSEFIPNVLEMKAIHQLADDYKRIQEYSESNGDFIISQLNVAEILERALDERNYSGDLKDFGDWKQLLEVVSDGNKCEDALGSDERSIASASFASSVMLNEDFNFENTCDWLNSEQLESSGNPTPKSGSTLWIIEISGDVSSEERLGHSKTIRSMLNDGNLVDSSLEYGVLSDDLISNDINESTLDNMSWLILLAIIVVIIVLSLSFRSIAMVVAPLSALLASLVWTYGIITLLGMKFSILEIAVAPVVLGLGIDYSIHLQRGYEKAKREGNNAAFSWAKSLVDLRIALSLAVITTVFAFLANTFSPLPPLKTFGYTLALGVSSAFVASSVTVGSIHVVIEKISGMSSGSGFEVEKLARIAVNFQRNNAPIVLLIVAIITGGSVIVAQQGLDTSFELADFLSEEEMEVMSVRTDIYESYEIDALKTVFIIIEPQESSESFENERVILNTLRDVEDSLTRIPGVVVTESPGSGSEWASYDSLYRILADAIDEDENFGKEYNIEVFGEDIATTSDFEDGDLRGAVIYLQNNFSVGDSLRGLTWSERVGRHVGMNDAGNEIQFLRIRIDVEAETSVMVDYIAEELMAEAEIISSDIGGRAYVVGDLIILSNVLSGLISSIFSSTAISLAVSLVVLLSLTRRLGQSLLVIVPVGLAGSWVVGSMAILGINWNVLTIMIIALTIGLGIDYSIHVWRRFESNKAKGMGIWSAMEEMYMTTGSSLLLSAGTTISGFLVLVLSPVPVIRDFGLVSSISVAFSLILALLVLPGLLAAEFRTNGSK